MPIFNQNFQILCLQFHTFQTQTSLDNVYIFFMPSLLLNMGVQSFNSFFFIYILSEAIYFFEIRCGRIR